MKVEITTPPAVEPVTLDEAKRFARMHLDLTDHDEMVLGLIKSARQLIEARVARCFLKTAIKETRVVPATGRIRLSRFPVKQLLSLSIGGFPVDPLPILIPPADILASPGSTIEITYEAGADSVADVPEVVKTIIKMLVAHWLDKPTPTSRDAQNPVPLHVDALCDALRWGGEIPR